MYKLFAIFVFPLMNARIVNGVSLCEKILHLKSFKNEVSLAVCLMDLHHQPLSNMESEKPSQCFFCVCSLPHIVNLARNGKRLLTTTRTLIDAFGIMDIDTQMGP